MKCKAQHTMNNRNETKQNETIRTIKDKQTKYLTNTRNNQINDNSELQHKQ